MTTNYTLFKCRKYRIALYLTQDLKEDLSKYCKLKKCTLCPLTPLRRALKHLVPALRYLAGDRPRIRFTAYIDDNLGIKAVLIDEEIPEVITE
ncbi:MAG: hypothetical protein DRJ40_06290 [Thermoprotei archaeon]|nr:MAG: hypothetical protein DRJ40_06290 [Thermoprotei archaeon]